MKRQSAVNVTRLVVFAALVLTLACVPAAIAGKGGGGGAGARPGGGGGKPSGGSGATIDLVVLYSPAGDGLAHHYGRVTFNFSPVATDKPFVGLRCWQGSAWVYDGYVGYFPNAIGDSWFTLHSNYWANGVAATCTARLFYYDSKGNQNVLTTRDFPVAP